MKEDRAHAHHEIVLRRKTTYEESRYGGVTATERVSYLPADTPPAQLEAMYRKGWWRSTRQ